MALDVLCFLLRRNGRLKKQKPESVLNTLSFPDVQQYFELPFFNRHLSGGAPADESHV